MRIDKAIDRLKNCHPIMNEDKEALYPNLPTSEEYKESMESMFKYDFFEWSEPKYQCSECGGGMCRNEMVVCASYPPKYEYRCNKCGNVEYQRG